jgi:hypothetical protein
MDQNYAPTVGISIFFLPEKPRPGEATTDGHRWTQRGLRRNHRSAAEFARTYSIGLPMDTDKKTNAETRRTRSGAQFKSTP